MPTPVSRSNSLPPINEQLIGQVKHIFDEVQKSSSNHIKNFFALYRVQLIFARHTIETPNEVRLIGEQQFRIIVQGLLNRVLPLKKGEVSADRVVKFLGGYLKFINEKSSPQSDTDSDDESESTLEERFTSFLLRLLFPGFEAKDKNVRYRVLQIIVAIVPHLGAINEKDYYSLRSRLLGRISDKEASVRIQAVYALAKLCPSDDPPEGGPSILDVLIQTLAYDPSADVRRCVLCNLQVTESSLSAILERTRDTDTTIRKTVYRQVLSSAIITGDPQKDVPTIGTTHPNNLTKMQRELVMRHGLRDREPSVRAAAGTLLSNWVNAIDSMTDAGDVKAHDHIEQPWDAKVLSLLGLFDLGEGTVAMNALFSLFTSTPEMFKNISFLDDYWRGLTPEKAFFARVFVEYCKNKKDETALDQALPVVMVIAYHIQASFNTLLEQANLDEDSDYNEDKTDGNVIIVSELLRLAVHLDYSDEIGRRKTLVLINQMLQNEYLPLKLVSCCLDILRTLYPKEQDLIKVIVELVHDLCDAVCDDDSKDDENSNEDSDKPILQKNAPTAQLYQEVSPERKHQIEQVELKCLDLVIKMLERIHSTFERNIILSGIVDELIIPAITKSKNITICEMAYKAYGLCSLIAKDMAVSMIGLVMKKISSATGNIKITMLYCLFDALMVHENFVFKGTNGDSKSNLTLETVTSFLLMQIQTEEDLKIRALLCCGTSKLVISGIITTVEAIQTLIKTYLSPITANNQELRQCLAVFFAIYSHSSGHNQKRMADIFIQVFLDLSEDRKQFEELDEGIEVISSAQIAAMFLEWTDPLRLLNAVNAQGGQLSIVVDDSVQLSMAESIIRLLFGKGLTISIEKEDKKILCQLLNKLHVPDIVDDYKIRSLKLLMDNLTIRRPLQDTVCLNAFKKFESSITKKFEKQLEGFTEEEFRTLEELTELFEFLDSIIPLDEEDLEEYEPSKRKGKKRRSTSLVSRSRSVSPHPKIRNRAKRPRLSNDDEVLEDDKPSPVTVAPRVLPKRSAAARTSPEIIVISSDSDEETRKPIVKVTHSAGVRKRTDVKTEDARIDRELLSGTSSLTFGEVSYDSIMDDSIMDDPDSEEEVNELLAESE